jgi:hypothetical protein
LSNKNEELKKSITGLEKEKLDTDREIQERDKALIKKD